MLPPSRQQLCVTTDSLVEGVHFSLRHFTLEEVGYKALAVNLSDLAAMGAAPAWALCAVCLPKSYGVKQVRALARGMALLAREHGLALVGGNFSGSKQLSITFTVAGHVPPKAALTRSGARAGDLLYCSGTLGDARAGLRLLGTRGAAKSLVLRQKRPTPRITLGLLSRRYAHAAIDLSDGFAQDLGHLCRASKVGAQVEFERLPISPALLRYRGSRTRALHEALRGGEDYELLLAVPSSRAKAFERACSQAGEQVAKVGRFTPGRGVHLEGAGPNPLSIPSGFDHFRRASI